MSEYEPEFLSSEKLQQTRQDFLNQETLLKERFVEGIWAGIAIAIAIGGIAFFALRHHI
jgi:hypothetical protein